MGTRILVTKPGVLNQRDKAALRKVGVVCVEADDPAGVKLIQAEGPELGGNDLLYAAITALASEGNGYDFRKRFVDALAKALPDPKEPAHDR